MATTSAPAALISLEKYMATSYRPDREYIDGEVRERNIGKRDHARLQALLAIWFGSHETEWGVMVATEWRTKVSATRVRIPDVVLVVDEDQPEVLTEPPILIVESLSPDDSYSDTQERAGDYRQMGVLQTVWIIDPKTRTGRYCIGDSWTAADRLIVPGTHIFVELGSLFDRLDRNRQKPAQA
jgi:Uma2 family endonuclease